MNVGVTVDGTTLKDGAYECPNGWEVKEQWQRTLKSGNGLWETRPNPEPKEDTHWHEYRQVARLVPIEKVSSGHSFTEGMETGTYFEPKPAKSAADIMNELDENRAIKWESLSDGGKWTRALEAMELYRNQ